MRSLYVLGCLLLVSVLSRTAATPCGAHEIKDRTPIIVIDDPPPGGPPSASAAQIQPPAEQIPAGPRTETTSNVSRNSTQVKSSSDTTDSKKVKVKELKNGNKVTVIVDKSKTKNKTEALADSYDQTNHTIVQDGIEDQTSLTKEKQQQLKEVSVAKNVTRQRIVTDKEGNIVSDTVKSKTSEKDRKSEKTKESEVLIHTIKKVTTDSPVPCETTTTTELPAPCETTTTTKLPPLPCGCKRTTTTSTTTTTTTEAPPLPCGCRRPPIASD